MSYRTSPSSFRIGRHSKVLLIEPKLAADWEKHALAVPTPSFLDLLADVSGERLRQVIASSSAVDHKGRYLHWDDMLKREPPEHWGRHGSTDIHHQGLGPGEDACHGEQGSEVASCAAVVHLGVQG